MVVAFVDAETGENHNHDEDVVNGERFFKEIAGKVLGEDFFAVDFERLEIVHVGQDFLSQDAAFGIFQQFIHVGDAVYPFGFKEEKEAEEHGEGYPHAGPDGGFFYFDDMVFFVEQAKVHGKHEDDKDHESGKEYES